MKCVAISDFHSQLDKLDLPAGDVLFCAGDATGRGSIVELSKFNADLEKHKSKYKEIIYIAGNHELLFASDPSLAKSIITNATYLQDSMAQVKVGDKEIKIWGSPWVLEFGNWAFGLKRNGQMREKWDLIPDDIDILITHSPPYGILDEADEYSGHLGCPDLLEAVLRIKPKFHLFGHIHNGAGIKEFNGTTFINASSCDENYKPTNPPIEFEV
jgi:Icc-related predicted phosphoesterase